MLLRLIRLGGGFLFVLLGAGMLVLWLVRRWTVSLLPALLFISLVSFVFGFGLLLPLTKRPKNAVLVRTFAGLVLLASGIGLSFARVVESPSVSSNSPLFLGTLSLVLSLILFAGDRRLSGPDIWNAVGFFLSFAFLAALVGLLALAYPAATPREELWLWIAGCVFAFVGMLLALWERRSVIDRRVRSVTSVDISRSLVVGLALFLLGSFCLLYNTYGESNTLGEDQNLPATSWAGGIANFLALFLTFGGVVLAIYSIKGVLDRPHSIESLWEFIGNMMDSVETEIRDRADVNGFLAFMGEYPAVGALSCFHGQSEMLSESPEKRDDTDWLLAQYHPRLLRRIERLNERRWRVLLVCPTKCESPNGCRCEPVVRPDELGRWAENTAPQKSLAMNRHISDYGEHLGFEKLEIDAAKRLNWAFLSERLAKLSAGRFIWRIPKHDTAKMIPRYQAIVCGSCARNLRPEPKEAVVFFALRSPAKLAGEGSGNSGANGKNSKNSGSPDSVPIMAWHVTDRSSVRDIFEEIAWMSNTDSNELFNAT